MSGILLLSPINVLAILDENKNDAGNNRSVLTRGGVSNTACSSRIRLFDPLTRKVPSVSVAASFRYRPLRREVSMAVLGGSECAHAPFGNHHWDIAPHIQLSVSIRGGYLDTGVFEAFLERLAKYDVLAWRTSLGG